MGEPRGGTQDYIDISAVAEARREAIDASRITVAFLEMLVKEWNIFAGSGARALALRDLAIIEIERLSAVLDVLERLQYPSRFRK